MNTGIVRKIPILGIILSIGLCMLSASTASAKPKKHAFQLPSHALEVAPGLFYLGIAEDVDFRPVQGFAIIHPRRGFGHKPGHGGGGNGGGGNGGNKGNGGGGGSTCFAFLANGARWKATEDYAVDPSNDDSLSAAFVTDSIEAALTAWDDEVGFDIFGDEINAVVDGVDEVSPDGTNEFLFGNISDPGAIAVTIVWGIFSGPPRGRELG